MRKTNNLFLFSWDSLTIYDGDSSTSPVLGSYCGNSIPPSHVSSINEVLIHFQSNSGENFGGFQMEYNPLGKQITSMKHNTDIMRIIIEKYGSSIHLA